MSLLCCLSREQFAHSPPDLQRRRQAIPQELPRCYSAHLLVLCFGSQGETCLCLRQFWRTQRSIGQCNGSVCPRLARLIEGLERIPSVDIYGITYPKRFEERYSTLSLRIGDYLPRTIAEFFAKRGIFTWMGTTTHLT